MDKRTTNNPLRTVYNQLTTNTLHRHNKANIYLLTITIHPFTLPKLPFRHAKAVL